MTGQLGRGSLARFALARANAAIAAAAARVSQLTVEAFVESDPFAFLSQQTIEVLYRPGGERFWVALVE